MNLLNNSLDDLTLIAHIPDHGHHTVVLGPNQGRSKHYRQVTRVHLRLRNSIVYCVIDSN